MFSNLCSLVITNNYQCRISTFIYLRWWLNKQWCNLHVRHCCLIVRIKTPPRWQCVQNVVFIVAKFVVYLEGVRMKVWMMLRENSKLHAVSVILWAEWNHMCQRTGLITSTSLSIPYLQVSWPPELYFILNKFFHYIFIN